MYARFNEKGKLEIYDKPYVRLGGSVIANPTRAAMAKAGYKPLVSAEIPETGAGQTLKLDYRDDGECITEVYEIIGGVK